MRNRLWPALLSFCLGLSSMHPAIGDDLGRFDRSRDLFLPQFDCKTDVDDLHSVAAVATMLRDDRFEGVEFHAVAGAYGRQGGLYVPASSLFELAFGEHWSDAHNDRDRALATVVEKVVAILRAGGGIWVAEAGQSDFTADWLVEVGKALSDIDLSEHIDLRKRVHVVQHSDWNEESATPEKLVLVKRGSSYHKIPDGNAAGNGTPGFKSGSPELWQRATGGSETGELWREARRLGEEFNGQDGRYDNAAVASGGMDFSDTAETCWVFGFGDLFDAGSFFDTFSD